MTIPPSQTQALKHCAEVALHIRFMAVALTESDRADQIELAGLLLELSGWTAFSSTKAAPDSAQALLGQVRAGYHPAWKNSKDSNPPRQARFCPAQAARDLATSHTRFLRLQRAIYLERPEPRRILELARLVPQGWGQDDRPEQGSPATERQPESWPLEDPSTNALGATGEV